MPTSAELEQLRHRLETDYRFYAESLLKIVDQSEQTVPLLFKPAQVRLEEEIAKQEAAAQPVRGLVLKARKEGISTAVQGLLLKRTLMRRNHRSLVLAHDKKTAGEIFEMAEGMYSNLPEEEIAGLALRPPISSSAKGQEMAFGQAARNLRLEGNVGLNSAFRVDTANEYEAGRGFTYHSVHLSEFAFWQQPEKKLRAVLNTVPDLPNTLVIIESTANGLNLFRKLWVEAMSGRSDYFALFIAWHEDPAYTRPFANEEAREEFEADLGEGPWGEHEPDLIEAGVSLEQLNWRRWAIVNKSHGDLRSFWREYPANWEEAFLSSGRQVFAAVLVSKVLERTEAIEESPAAGKEGLVRGKSEDEKVLTYMGNEVRIPQKPLWIPEAELGAEHGVATPRWKVWEPPWHGHAEDEERELPRSDPGQYVVFVDSASGAETVTEGQDYFSIQVINHRTRTQCAEWHARGIDADLVRMEAFLIAHWYAPEFLPWLGVEVTGGYGVSIATGLYRIMRYPMLYFRVDRATKGERPTPVLGWQTSHTTKPLLVDNAKELLRIGQDGIRSPELAGELQTFVRDEKGKMGAEEDYFDDRLDAWMGAQYIAHEKPTRRSRKFAPPEPVARVRRAPSLRRKPRTQARPR